MRLLLTFFIFSVLEARFSSWDDIDDDKKEEEEDEKDVECGYLQGQVKEAGKCKNHYYICDADKKKVMAHCPEGLVLYDQKCTYREDAPSCPGYKSNLDLYRSKNQTIRNSICKRRVDGHYNFPCENTHYSCKNETVTWHSCPKGLIYHHHSCLEDKCIKKEHVYKCWEWMSSKFSHDPRCANVSSAPRSETKILADPKKEFSCKYKYNGHYSAGRCLNHFHICIYFKHITGYCPEGMVYWNWRCFFKRDVKHCPEYKTDLEMYHSKNETEKNSICEIRGDDTHYFPCENERYECKNGKTIWKKCPPGEVFGKWYTCVNRIHNEECPEFEGREVEEIDPNREGPHWPDASEFFIEK